MAKKDISGTGTMEGKRISAEDLKNITCENCGGRFFRQVHAFKQVPAILSQQGKEEIIPIPTFRCDDCGHINEEFMPI
jgi:predicted nucleic acid-binding Zn ribbon protein